ncbi:MAG: TonB-dependent receptor [Bacteroidales bacterium]|nr:TonB-dependent receptor [Bacteroidales bacterium]
MIYPEKISLLLVVLLMTAKLSLGQMIFDTLQLREMEILSVQAEQGKTIKTTTIDSLAKSGFGQLNLSELLAANSVVFVKSYGRGGLATASFRGTAASHTQVLWNGFQISSPMLGQVDLSLVPNAFFDRASLRYGGSSIESVPGALGGSIELESEPEARKPALDVLQLFGSYQTYITTASLNIQSKRLVSDTRFIYQNSQNDFPYYNNGVLPSGWMRQEKADLSNIGFTQRLTFLISGFQQISLTSWNQWNKRNIPATMTNVWRGGNLTEFQDDFFSRNVLAWSFHRTKTRLQVSAAWFHEKQQYFLETFEEGNPVADTLINSGNTSGGYFSKVKLDRQFGMGLLFSAGFDLRHEKVKTTNYSTARQRNSGGLFVRMEKSFRQRLAFDILIRQEMADGKLLPLMPFLGVNYQLLPGADFNIRASVSRNFHLPSLNDLYWVPGGNENLKPERAFQLEGGLNYKRTFQQAVSFGADLSFFSSQIKDWIQWKPGNYQFWTAENIAEVHARGVEASFRMQGKWNRLIYTLRTAYTFTRTSDESDLAKEKGFAGEQLIYVPVHNANGFVHLAFNDYFFRWQLNYTGKRKTTMNDSGSFPDVLPAYWLNDVSLGKTWKLKKFRIELKGVVKNLFDVNYQAILWRAMPGRNFEISLRFLIN